MITTTHTLRYQLKGWKISIVIMIQKETKSSKLNKLNKLRVLNKYEADYDLIFKYVSLNILHNAIKKRKLGEINKVLIQDAVQIMLH